MLPVLENSIEAARDLLGWKLIHNSPAGLVSGYIVETEAYHQNDPASHTFRGQTHRNAVMFGPAGAVYIYFTYGMHYCMNIVTGPRGQGEAVLIRALEPVEGLEFMRHARDARSDLQLTNGPAKLVQALGITSDLNGIVLNEGPLQLLPGFEPANITQATRIGITKAIDRPWRFFITGNPYISRSVPID